MIDLSPIGDALGTEVCGIDLAQPMADAAFRSVQTAFAEHPVLAFRGQTLSATELAAFRPALWPYPPGRRPEVSASGYPGSILPDQCRARWRRRPVRRYPVTGRRHLQFCMVHTAGFVGMSHATGAELLRELLAHSTASASTYYHAWRPGDVVLWDEHATMHRNAGNFPAEQRRILLRAMVDPDNSKTAGI